MTIETKREIHAVSWRVTLISWIGSFAIAGMSFVITGNLYSWLVFGLGVLGGIALAIYFEWSEVRHTRRLEVKHVDADIAKNNADANRAQAVTVATTAGLLPSAQIPDWMAPRGEMDSRVIYMNGQPRGPWSWPVGGGERARGDLIEAFVDHFYDLDRTPQEPYRAYLRRAVGITFANSDFSLVTRVLTTWGLLRDGQLIDKMRAREFVEEKRRQILTPELAAPTTLPPEGDQ